MDRTVRGRSWHSNHTARWNAALGRVVVAMAISWSVTSCVPGATGVTRLPYREGATYVVEAGTTLDVTTTVSLAEAGLDVSDVTRAAGLWVPSGGGEETAVVMTLWGLVDVEVEEGWTARAWDVRVVRSTGSNDAEVYRFELVARIEVPLDAYDLTRRVRATWSARQGGRVPLDLLVQATAPAATP